MCLLCFNYCRFYAKLALFTVFVLTLQTDIAADWCFWFSVNDSFIEQVWSPCHSPRKDFCYIAAKL